MGTQTSITFQGLGPGAPGGRNALMNPERGLRFEIGTGRIASDEVKQGADSANWPLPAMARGRRLGRAGILLLDAVP